jgi:hypothetical protein
VNSLLSAWKSFGLVRMTSGWQADKRMDDGESMNPLIRLISADHCGGLWVVNGGNTLAGTCEFPSQYMEVVYPTGTMSTGSTHRLRTGTDGCARVGVCFDTPCGRNARLRGGWACQCGGLWARYTVSHFCA